MSADNVFKMDALDKKILYTMLKDGEFNLKEIAQKAGVSKSTVHNRIKKLRETGVLKGLLPWLDYDKLGNTITAISLIRAKYGPKYADEVGRRIANIKGVWAVYFVLGENDFVVMSRARSKAELEETVEKFAKLDGVERANTAFALKILKEDPREAVRIE